MFYFYQKNIYTKWKVKVSMWFFCFRGLLGILKKNGQVFEFKVLLLFDQFTLGTFETFYLLLTLSSSKNTEFHFPELIKTLIFIITFMSSSSFCFFLKNRVEYKSAYSELIQFWGKRSSTSQTWLSVSPGAPECSPRSSTVFSVIVASTKNGLIAFESQNFFHIFYISFFHGLGSLEASQHVLSVARGVKPVLSELYRLITLILRRGLCQRLRTMNLPHKLKKFSFYREDEVCLAGEQLCRVSGSHLSFC